MSLNCSICKQPKNELTPKKSKLLPAELLACKTCIGKGWEPRHIVIIAGRSAGADKVKEYIKKHLYPGEEITAQELMT